MTYSYRCGTTAEHTIRPNNVLTQESLLEHVMRVTSDASLLTLFTRFDATRDERLRALGTLLARETVDLPYGSPLLAWTANTTLTPQWRRVCDAHPMSLFAQLEALRCDQYAVHFPTADPWSELQLRLRLQRTRQTGRR